MGKVSINSHRGKLRLVWSHAGKRYFLHTGLSDVDSVNWIVSEGRAKQIEADVATGNFDPTLRKYKPEADSASRETVVELFERFIKWKRSRVYHRTIEKYCGLVPHLELAFRTKAARSITEVDAMKFRDRLLLELAPCTAKERIGLLSACWNWAEAGGAVEGNPWSDVRVRVPPKPRPKPFTRDEVTRILREFSISPYYRHYYDYVRFLFGTGVRTGEAIGLLWEHVTAECDQVWVGETYSRGHRKETKTNEARILKMPPDLQQMLLARRSLCSKGLVFPSPKGGAIDDHNFRNRAWKKSLTRAGVTYRKPYLTRSTFISHALAPPLNMNPVDVAELTGHDVETLYREYAASIDSNPKIPDLNFDADVDEDDEDSKSPSQGDD